MSKGRFCYWGKAGPPSGNGPAYHLLPFHGLDVAATLQSLLVPAQGVPRFPLRHFARDLGWSVGHVLALLTYFAALHDIGKFAGTFQCLLPGMSEQLAASAERVFCGERHDSLGLWLWRRVFARALPSPRLPEAGPVFWQQWIECAVGHHGRPPLHAPVGALEPPTLDNCFTPGDIDAAKDFAADCAELLLPEDLPMPADDADLVIRRYSFDLAGLMVMADWLGSDRRWFPYRAEPMDLARYWETEARPRAQQAVQASGLAGARPAAAKPPGELLPGLRQPGVMLTPLQRFANSCELVAGAQLLLLEDVSGAGKTEAGLLLAHRLMAAGRADGLYVALPTMATANQMHRQIGAVYGGFFAEGAQPSIVFGHGARDDLPELLARVPAMPPADDFDYGDARRGGGDWSDASASTQRSAWLADFDNAALLADVGVGSIDQALLGVVPVRYQSLRLYGLCRKVLIIDGVHAYTMSCAGDLICRLVAAHARHGGTTILLATAVPEHWRRELLQAFETGRGGAADTLPPVDASLPYPAITHLPEYDQPIAVATRPDLQRRVAVAWHYNEESVVTTLLKAAKAGGCAAWIRNSIGDAVAAYDRLQQRAPHPEKVLLFHSRYLMADRLALEQKVLALFGPNSTAADRAGWILIASPVLQESLDVDIDVLATDLAPIDLLIQRAGREQRHRRDAHGNRRADGGEGRQLPVLHVLAPAPAPDPPANWFSAALPRSAKVYPDHGRLWLTAQTLRAARAIAMPDAARHLIESVYGEDAESRIPESLRAASTDAGAEREYARLTGLDLDQGYTEGSSPVWYEDLRLQTGTGEPAVDVHLVVRGPDGLEPLAGPDRPWSQSAVCLPVRLFKATETGWRKRFGNELEVLGQRHPQLRASAVLLPMVPLPIGGWRGIGRNAANEVVEVLYDWERGVTVRGQ